TADRGTHLKIVAMSLVCATLVAGIGVAARATGSADNGGVGKTVVQAGPAVDGGRRGRPQPPAPFLFDPPRDRGRLRARFSFRAPLRLLRPSSPRKVAGAILVAKARATSSPPPLELRRRVPQRPLPRLRGRDRERAGNRVQAAARATAAAIVSTTPSRFVMTS